MGLRGMALIGVALCAVAFRPSAALAGEEPYLSVRTGLRCSQCHVNRTGGGARTDFGSVYGQTRLPMAKFGFLDRKLNGFLSVGANFRVEAAAAVSDATPRTEIDITEESFQLEARVVPGVLALYLDQLVGPGGASTREAFALLDLPLEGYVKAGKFLLPYGIRLADDAEFIRERTGFTYDTPDQGLEAGVEPGPLSLFLALTNGTQGGAENDGDKQLTGTAALTFPRLRFGVSASRNQGPEARREVVGGFGGLRLGRLVLVGEADYIFDSFTVGPDVDQFAAFVEGDLLIIPGLNLKTTYGFLDPNRDIGENARTRWRFGLEVFPIQLLQVSLFYTVLEDIPQATTDVDRVRMELHLFF